MGALDFLKQLKTQPQSVVKKPEEKMILPTMVQSKSLQKCERGITLDKFQELPADYRAKAMERLNFIELVNATKKRLRINYPEAVEYAAINYAHEFPILLKSGKNGISALTYNNYRNWDRLIRGEDKEQALLLLADKYKSGIQEMRGDPRFWQLFRAFYLNENNLPLTVCYRMAVKKFRQLDQTSILPKLADVRYRVKQIPATQLILARQGEEALKNIAIDYISRDWSNIEPGELAVGDSRTFDTRVRVWDEEKEKWVGVRPTITGLMDARSWKLIAYWISTEPINSQTLIDTMRLYCLNNNMRPPQCCYFDNGKDYTASGFSTPFICPDGSGHSIFKELGIKMVNSLCYNGRAKTIERFFRDMMQNFDKQFPDYLGSKVGQKTLTSAYLDNHAEELPSMQQFCSLFQKFCEEYNKTPKGGKIHEGLSPNEIWAKRKESIPWSIERLTLAFYQPRAIRQVKRGPAIEFNKKLYYSDKLVFGEKVMVKTSTLDDDHVLICKMNGAVITAAYTRKSINAMALDDEAARLAISENLARQRRQLKEAQTALSDLTGNMHLVSPLELFLAPPDAKLIKTGEKVSVKGASHHFTRWTIPDTIDGVKAEEINFIEDEEKALLEEFAEVTETDAVEEEFLNESDIAAFHRMMKANAKNDEY